MPRFFNRIRKQLAKENRFFQYSRYAIGEILLVVIGILIALEVDNWNRLKEQEKAFNTTLEQVYTHLHSAKELDEWDITISRKQLEICQKLQKQLDTFSNFELLKYAHFLDWMPGTGFKLTNFDDYLGKIEIETNDSEKSSLLFHLNQFFIMVNEALEYDIRNYKVKYFEPIFRKHNISVSSGQPNTEIMNALPGERQLLDETSIKKIDAIRGTAEFMAALISTEERIKKILWSLEFRKNETESTRNMLLNYEPNMSLRYDKLSMIGSALKDSAPISMELVDIKDGKWKVVAELDKGSIMFTTNYANYFTWGSNSQDGTALSFWGDPIPVEQGRYSITINLEKMNYKIEAYQ